MSIDGRWRNSGSDAGLPIKRYLTAGKYVAALIVYCVISLVAYWPLAPLSSQRIVTCGCNDIAQQTWFLSWTPFALSHGINPLWTGWINYPYGVNLASNTSMPLLGILASPITVTVGPVAAFNLLIRAAFVLSAAAMFFCLIRLLRHTLAAFVGGLLYGFSPYMAGQGNGHINLLFVPLPPLIFMVVLEVLVRQRCKPRTSGLVLGLLVIAQFFISTETLANTIVMAIIGIVIAAIAGRHCVRERLHHVVTSMLWALGIVAVVIGYPVWFQLVGPQHLSGPAQPTAGLFSYRSDLLGLIIPTASQRFGPMHLIVIGSSFAAGNVPENGTYIGLPLLIIALGIVIALRRNALVKFCAAMAVCAFVLSLGPSLMVDNHDTHFPLPFDLFGHLPLLQSEVPIRYTLYLQLFMAVLVVVGLDRVIERVGHAARDTRAAKWFDRSMIGVYLPTCVIAIVMVATLVPLVPRFPIPTQSAELPAYFRSAAVKRIPEGSVVLTYPYPVNPDNVAMLWQANSTMRFKLLGDYAVTPQPNGSGTTAPPQLQPIQMQELLEFGMYGSGSSLGAQPPYTRATFSLLREFLSRYQVGTVIVEPTGPNSKVVERYLVATLGQPVHVDGLLIWYAVKTHLEHDRTTR